MLSGRTTAVMGPLAALLLATGCGSCPSRAPDGAWKPDWLDSSPPRLDVDLEIVPSRRGPTKVMLAWRIEPDGGFGYDVRNRVRIERAQSRKGPREYESLGSIDLAPLPDGRAEVGLTTHAISGGGTPTTRIYVMEPSGELEAPDPATRSMLMLVFPVLGEEIAPGEVREISSVLPAAGARSEVHGTSRIGIVGFARVAGLRCATVALDHEARVLARVAGSDSLEETGSSTRLRLLGYFDIKVGRYIAVAVSEVSVTVQGSSRTTTTRNATYLLKGLEVR
jgi:hypothetical protein